ncbi:MAG: hypothetical protein RSA86_05380 [Christensenellaceae bacterium]
MISLLIGLIALVCAILPFFVTTIPYLSIVGFILAIVAVATGKKIINVDPKDKNARAGKAIGTICIVLALIPIVLLLILPLFGIAVLGNII